MTLRAFFRVRRQQRLQRRASRAMYRFFGAAWSENQAGIVSMLSSPSPVYVLDVEMLAQVVRGAVAEALSGSAVAEEQGFPSEPVYVAEGPGEETFDVEPAAEVEAPVFEERSNGVEAGPVDMSNDDRRRAFVRSFLDEQKAARGGVPTSLRR